MAQSIWKGEKPFAPVFASFVLVGVIGLSGGIYGSLFLLCAVECTALPWLSLIIGPVISGLVILPLCVWLGVGSYRSAKQLEEMKGDFARKLIIISVIWLPVLSTGLWKLVGKLI